MNPSPREEGRRGWRDDAGSVAPSPTDARSTTLRPESAATMRDDEHGHGYGQLTGLGLSDSMYSTDTIRRRSDLTSPGGYGTIYSPSIADSVATAQQQERPHSRNVASGSQAGRSPALAPQLRTPRPVRSKPPNPRRTSLTQAPHRGGKFSVDDDPDEVEADAAGRQRRREQYSAPRRGPGTLSRLQSFRDDPAEVVAEEEDAEEGGGNRGGGGGGDDDDDDFGPSGLGLDSGQAMVEPSLGGGEPPDSEDVEAEDEEEEPQSGDAEDDDGDISDAESFTLKDRQQAINDTHPFGIRLWKPALYKKSRSVQKTAEGDIHSSPGGQVSTALLFFNIVWTLLFGWWMALITALGALTCVLFAAAPSGREYSRVLWGLAGYLFYPFGKFVRLEQDEAYLHEDRGEGRSISEYEQWQSGDLENGRLFFGPSDHSRSIVGRSRRSVDSEPSETDSLLQRSRVLDVDDDDHDNDGEYRHPDPDREERIHKRRLFGRGQWNIGRVIFFVFFYSLIAPSLILVSGACWFLVFWIPMAKVTMLLFSHLRRHPLALSFESDSIVAARDADAPYSSILLCTYRAVGIKYWKYTVDGTNIFLINLMAVVGFVIFDYLMLEGVLHVENALTSPAFLFVSALLSIIPLAYFIGQAVASISAQSSMGLGAAINAFFSTVVEVFLYCVALSQGKARLVEGSVVGSIFAGILFLPGLSMCFGAIKRKTQRFNAKSAGVTSTMLLFAVISAFSPTLFYQIYGTHEIKCQDCVDVALDGGDCRRCFYTQMPALDDRFYISAVRPFCHMNAMMLFLAYVIGLWFTLRTHAAVIWNTEADEKKHDDHHATLHQAASSSQRPSQGHQSSVAESSAADLRDSQMYKRILGQSLKHAGLPPNPDDLAAPHHGGGGAPAQLSSTGNGTPHVVPPKATTTAHMVSIPGLSEADNQLLVREVAEMAATAATLAARDTIRRRTSGFPPGGGGSSAQAARPTPARLAVYEEVGIGGGGGGGGHLGTPAPGHGGHDAPNWSRRKSSVILLGATVLYAIIAEILVNTVDVVLEGSSIDEKFLGITLFALVPNTTEFLNAISFAMNGNIALSMEIGSAYALQVCLLQIPALVLFSAFYAPAAAGIVPADPAAHTFSLLFPQWDMVSVILCVFLLSYMYGEGKSNYFKGSILLLSYFVVLAGFFFSGFASSEMGARRFDVLRNGEWIGGPVGAGGRVR